MKTKRLLTGLVLLAATMTLQAADYFYTNNARYKVVGENLFTQGSPEDNLSGWKSYSGKTLDQLADTFAIENEGGPDGGKCLKVLNSGIGASILNADIMLESGKTYLITYKVKGSTDRQGNSLDLTKDNCQNIFVNADGSNSLTAAGYAAIAQNRYYYNDGWTEMNFAYTVGADAIPFLVVSFNKLLADDCFADFAVYPVEEVCDDRVFQRSIDRAKLLLTIPELTNSKSALEGMLGEMEEFIETNESKSEQADYMAGLENRMTKFLDANGVDMSSYFSYFTFDELTPKGNSNVSGWTTGSRWGTGAANAVFPTVFAVQSIGNSYELGKGSLSQEKDLPAGKYLYVVSAQGYDYPNKSSIIDYHKQVTGVKMFINADSLEMTDLPSWGPKNYAKVFTVNEGEKVNLGVCNTGVSNANQIWFDNHYIYLLGGNKEEIDDYVINKKLKDAQNRLKVMTDSAKVVVEKPQYIFGKAVLRDSIAVSDNVYATQTDPVNSPAVLDQQMNYMRSAIRAYYALNVEIIALQEDINDCKALITDEKYTDGKAELQEIITKAENFYQAVNPEVRDSAAIVAIDKELVDARQNFFIANISYKNPLMITIQNPTFKEGPSSRSAEVPGWDDANVNRNSKSGWKAEANSAFETGYAINYARNNSSCEAKYLAQDVVLERTGVYTFSAEMLAFHSGGRNSANTGVYFFVGKEGLDGEKIDSVIAYTPDQVPVRYSINMVIDQPTTLRFGVEARNNKSCTRIYVSGCQVAYSGSYEKYQRDSVIAVAQPTVDSLAAEIAIAQNLKNTSRNKEQFATAVQDFETAIGHAETVKNTEVASIDALKAVLDEITALKNAENAYKTSGVWPAEGEYFDFTPFLLNADLQEVETNENTEKVFTHWISEGNTAYQDGNNMLAYVFNETSAKNMKVHQVIENMPIGKYQFMAHATYKLKASFMQNNVGENFPMDEDMNGLTAVYNECKTYSVFANTTSMVMKGLLTGLQDDEWREILSSQDYRHHRFGKAFQGNRLENWLTFDVTTADAGKIDLGIEAKDANATEVLWAKNFKLFFWGDKAEDISGIENNRNSQFSIINSTSVYDLQGRRIVKPARGLYIQNGRKVYVK